MADIIQSISNLISPREAEAKVISGDPEASQLIKSLVPQQQPGSSSGFIKQGTIPYDESGHRWQQILSQAQALKDEVTVYGGSKPTSIGIPIKDTNAYGVYDRNDKTIHIDTTSRNPHPTQTLVHELSHFLHIQNQPDSLQPHIEGLNNEDIANKLSGLSPSVTGLMLLPDSTSRFPDLWKGIFGTDYPVRKK